MNEDWMDFVEERLDFLEFRQDLLFSGSDLSKVIYDFKFKRKQYEMILDLMDCYSISIRNKEKKTRRDFENDFYAIAPEYTGNSRICEDLVKAFNDSGRYTEVYYALYGRFYE